MTVRDPVATVVGVGGGDGVLRVTITIDRRPHPPLFPASLLIAEGNEAIRLDRLIEQTDNAYVFESYGESEAIVAVGGTFVFRPWWTPDALDLVRDTAKHWSREPYPDDGDHDHCPLTWETIAAYEGDGTGYRSGRDWISVAAFERYIRDDHLRVRRSGP